MAVGLTVCLSLSATAAPGAAETARLPYRALSEKIMEFEKLPMAERDKVDLELRIRPRTSPAEPLAIWMETGGRRVALPVDPTGRIDVRPAAGIAAGDLADATVETNQPKRTLDLELTLAPRLPDPVAFRYADLRAAAAQVDRLAKRSAGLPGWLVPATGRMVFVCGQPRDCTLVLHRPHGPEVRRPGPDGRIELALTDDLDAENPAIEAPRPFVRILPMAD